MIPQTDTGRRTNRGAGVHLTTAHRQPRPADPNLTQLDRRITARIPVRNKDGIFSWTLVDEEDYETCSQHHWSLSKGYVVRGTEKGGKRRKILLHRQIMGLGFGDVRQVDHINCDKLDNRRSNLRIIPGSRENQQNKRSKPGSTSSYRGVTFRKDLDKWQAQAGFGGKYYFLGIFVSEDEAGAKARAFRLEHMPFTVEE